MANFACRKSKHTKEKSYEELSESKCARRRGTVVELHDSLNLTGAEVSISNLPAGAGVPFVHSHKQNEEIYAVLSGRGTMVVDGEIVELQAGDWLRVAPAGERQLSAAADSAISDDLYFRLKAGSLEGFTMTDGVVK